MHFFCYEIEILLIFQESKKPGLGVTVIPHHLFNKLCKYGQYGYQTT
jgi:hypothetical protein